MSNDIKIEGSNLIVHLNSEVGDAILEALLRDVIKSCKKSLAETSQRALEYGMGKHHLEDTSRDIQIITACASLLEYMGFDDAE